jgi:4-oxalocrotonate tautomerase
MALSIASLFNSFRGFEPGTLGLVPEKNGEVMATAERRTEEQKRAAVIEKVTPAPVEAVDAPRKHVSVWICDVPRENWGLAGRSAKDLGR